MHAVNLFAALEEPAALLNGRTSLAGVEVDVFEVRYRLACKAPNNTRPSRRNRGGRGARRDDQDGLWAHHHADEPVRNWSASLGSRGRTPRGAVVRATLTALQQGRRRHAV